jgi:copper chaperone CopZ
MTMQVFTVAGMTCEHCVRAVTAELSGLSGVERVDVDPGSGAVTVVADRELPESQLAGAVEEAGYTLVANPSEPR